MTIQPSDSHTAMKIFAPGDRVVAINTDMSRPILAPADVAQLSFHFPDGPLHTNQVYHVAAVEPRRDGAQGVFLTGLRVLCGDREVPWISSRRFLSWKMC